MSTHSCLCHSQALTHSFDWYKYESYAKTPTLCSGKQVNSEVGDERICGTVVRVQSFARHAVPHMLSSSSQSVIHFFGMTACGGRDCRQVWLSFIWCLGRGVGLVSGADKQSLVWRLTGTTGNRLPAAYNRYEWGTAVCAQPFSHVQLRQWQRMDCSDM